MKFCYIKDLDIRWFVTMVERSKRLPDAVSYDDTYVYLADYVYLTDKGDLNG